MSHVSESLLHPEAAPPRQVPSAIRRNVTALLALLCVAFVVGCGGGGDGASSGNSNQNTGPSRSFAMGFTPWPYDATTAAVDFVYSGINTHGDIIAHHLDAGIPWQEALDGSPYPAAVETEIATRLTRTSPGKLVYLAISPLNGSRDDLAGYWSAGTNEPLPPAWAARDFDSPEVVQAYTNFALDLIGRFNPTYFNLGIEASELAINDAARYDLFVTFAEQVATSLRAAFPNVRLMISIGLKSPGSAAAATINAELPRLIQHIDIVGASVYAYVFFDHADKGDPANLPANWLSQLQPLVGGKPVAVAETGWIAERLEIPAFSVDVPADAADQDAYLKLLFREAQAMDARFIIWFSLVDFDALWNGALGQDPVAHIWRDTGLYDESLNPRPALDTWTRRLAIPKR